MFPKCHLPLSSRLAEISLLVLLLWPAPVPIRHSHNEGASRSSGHQLLQHLQAHHGGLAKCQHQPDDWHWHWVFPGDDYLGLGSEPIAAADDTMLPMSCVDLFEPVHACFVEWLTIDPAISLAKVPGDRQYSFQSVALMHSRQSLPELLGVMRL